MKLLFLSQRFLMPMDTGGKIRTGNILKQLSKDHDITLISNVEYPKDSPYLDQMNLFCKTFIPVPWKETPKYSARFFFSLALRMFSPYPVNVLNDYSRRLQETVEMTGRSRAFDAAVCDFVQSALMFRNMNHLRTVLFQHNVESQIMTRHVEKSENPGLRFFWQLQRKKMLWFEKDACRRFDAVIAVSEQDQKLFEQLYALENVETIPTGVDVEFFSSKLTTPKRKNSLSFCGSMDWLPNEDAMFFFIRDVLPIIKAKTPDVSLTIIGRNPSSALKNLLKDNPEVVLTGWVEDTRPYISESQIVIVPIRIGGGTRMKIFEAMSMGKAVVSTTVGAEGLPVTDKENIIIEDDPHGFAAAILSLLEDTNERDAIGKRASEFVRKHFTWERVAGKFIDICRNDAS
jgi:sugar transferase (PEP-CTERM/EpsH1 system associated)